MKKQGLSTIVATTLILLITVVAITFLITFLIPFMKGNLNKGSECVDYGTYFSFDDSFNLNCKIELDSNTYPDLFLSVRAKSDAELAKDIAGFELEFVDSDGASTRVLQFIDKATGVAAPGDRPEDASASAITMNMCGSTLIGLNELKIPNSNEYGVISYRYNDMRDYTSVDIFPILKSGTVCEKSNSRALLSKCFFPNTNYEACLPE